MEDVLECDISRASGDCNSMTTYGMLLGKFMPPHMGHVYLAEFAQGFADDLAIVVCSLDREPIPGALRYAWMTELCPKARVIHLTEDLPQEPSEDPRFWELWETALRKILPHAPTHVFASEPYGAKLAEVLGATFVPVDLERRAVPIRATAIRNDPWTHVSFIPRPVRPYFIKRVSIFGPESSGKSTLAADLANHFRTAWVPEYARTWLETNKADSSPPTLDPSDFLTIVKGQIASEEALARNAQKVLVTDTDPLLSVLWSSALTRTCLPEVEALARGRTYDLTLLLDIDVPWIQDGVRYFPEQRAAFLEDCERVLIQNKRTYLRIRGSRSERLEIAIKAIESLMADSCSD